MTTSFVSLLPLPPFLLRLPALQRLPHVRRAEDVGQGGAGAGAARGGAAIQVKGWQRRWPETGFEKIKINKSQNTPNVEQQMLNDTLAERQTMFTEHRTSL